MKLASLVWVGMVFFGVFASIPVQAENGLFSADTARTLPEGKMELGVFAPLRYGLTPRVELALNPLWFFLAPHLLSSSQRWKASAS